MSEVGALAAGVAVLALVAWDVLATTLSLTSVAGPITRLLTGTVWETSRRAPGSVGTALQTRAGPVVLLVTVVSWVTLLWLGWWLVLLGVADGVESAATGAPASALERLYVAGFSVSTVGLGDFRPVGAGAQLAVDLAGLSGLLLATWRSATSSRSSAPCWSAASRRAGFGHPAPTRSGCCSPGGTATTSPPCPPPSTLSPRGCS